MSRQILKHGDVTNLILKAFFRVYNELDYGFLEKVNENSMAIAARKLGLTVGQQVAIVVHFDSEVVGEYTADLLVNNVFIRVPKI